jgi:hypothetical protein
MPNDADSPPEPPPRRDLWELPRITGLRTIRRRYDSPRRHVVAGRVVAYDQGVEIVVETDGDLPVRALSPALYVGTVELAENERISDREHHFFVLDEEALRPGDPITLGWVGNPARDREPEFRYEPPP